MPFLSRTPTVVPRFWAHQCGWHMGRRQTPRVSHPNRSLPARANPQRRRFDGHANGGIFRAREVAPEMPYRISGHETFALRFAWLPKAVRAVSETATILH